MNFLTQFQFLRPDFLYLLPLVVVVYFLAKKSGQYKNAWEKVCDKVLFNYLTNSNEKQKKHRTNFWIVCGFLSAVIALAGPSFRQTEKPMIVKENPLMIVLNVSSNMHKLEHQLTRLARAKIEITNVLRKTSAAPTGLIVYTYEPFLISPLSYDSNIIINLLGAVQTDIMPVDGDKLDRALELAVSRLSQNGFEKGNILVFTADVPLDFDKALKEAEKAASKGYRVSVYGLAFRQVSKLEKLAQTGEGVYFGSHYTSSQNLIQFINAGGQDVSENEPKTQVLFEDDGIWFVFMAMICLLACFRRGLLIIILCLLIFNNAEAGFLFNDNQEGALLFSSKEYAKAAEKFDQADWKASSYYKAKNYPAAIELLKNKEDVTSMYNMGNALAQNGQIDEAIKTYEKVLEKQPDHADAKFNLEYLKSFKKENPSSAQSQKSQQQKQNQNQQNEQNEQNNSGSEQNEQEQQQSAEENQNNNDENNEQNEQQEQSESAQSDEDDNPEESSDGESDDNQDLENDKQQDEQQAPAMAAKEQQAPEYDETVQAREQKFRTIKEDVGGLLKAFIREEYLKQRYKK